MHFMNNFNNGRYLLGIVSVYDKVFSEGIFVSLATRFAGMFERKMHTLLVRYFQPFASHNWIKNVFKSQSILKAATKRFTT